MKPIHYPILLCCFLCSYFSLTAQDIQLKNPSLEGIRGQGRTPDDWIGRNTPDVQPGALNITQLPSDGEAYVGLHSGPAYIESISQEVGLLGGKKYNLSADLAYAPNYAYKACYGILTVYGGDSPKDTAERLWTSGPFYHTSWKKYTFFINPKKNYKYITFMAGVDLPCDKSEYGSAILMDNLSAALRETPQLSAVIHNTCAGEMEGVITLKIEGVSVPCTISWDPGGATTNRITNLPAGSYRATVKHPNGIAVTLNADVLAWKVQSKVAVTPSPCYGDNNNSIKLETNGGTAPYRYYFNGGHTVNYSGTFEHLVPGYYNIQVEDEEGCKEFLSQIDVKEPLPLSFKNVQLKDISCSTVMDGKISIYTTGGTRPYFYSLNNGNWQTDSVWGKLNEGKYYYTVKDANGCLIDSNATIIRNMRECAVFVPTAFSPNNDGQNDLFRAKVNDDVTDYRLEVFSRWGEKVFSTMDPYGAWDGTLKGQQLPGGAYVWILLYTDSKHQARKQTGTIMLLR
ncbi:hypothetical protein DVR12_15410 [Chitinophaga silvatica]|uniref:Gliding motility-associated C-terminal domain-containing protein n=1 Tax=Chitinophaga silvatica TaxID=2282649 RepID=A0A3E1Y997_9BACT|nr:gliding motility-associated C-terminal domain-containing protein [Chitinophaga silvatica]RFS22029.1 hypothetical protein DVR12_15410 [Chitinophaga silvatica]